MRSRAHSTRSGSECYDTAALSLSLPAVVTHSRSSRSFRLVLTIIRFPGPGSTRLCLATRVKFTGQN
jgi:hypothetical protein